ncbi:zinc finger protein 236 [Echinococcus multilocularis]|uniref:Zinc finger protein 236 n=1 Tax=Echinococcus multilocularis TaxID=6211 RepID=A0A087VYQ4_ECHMU|nr:zinc finger protein 236 [Echinococcus multilocularis]
MYGDSTRARSSDASANETQRNALSIPIPAASHEDTAIYALDDFDSFQEPLGYMSNAGGNLRGDEYPMYHLIDPDNCHVLKEIVYLNAVPQEITPNDFSKGAWLADLESAEVGGVGNTDNGFALQATPSASAAFPETAVDLRCPECGESANCECQLYLHKILQHASLSALDELKCQICGKKCSRISAFKSHLSLHLLRNDQVCSNCQTQISCPTAVHDTEEQIIPMPSNQYRCRLCGVNHSSLTQLRIHYKHNHPKRQTDNSEPLSTSQMHRSPEPPTSQPHGRNCKVKASTFIRELATASKHKRRHAPPAPDPVPSPQVERIDYTQHVKKIFISKKKQLFQCEICKKKLSSMTTTKAHVLTHLGVKPFSCPICSKSFTQKGSVDTHMAIHNAAKKLSCPFCQKKFTFKQNLDVHLSRYHSKLAKSVVNIQQSQELHSFIVAYGCLSYSILSSFYLFLSMFAGYTGRRCACRFCFLTFPSPSMYCSHELLHLKRRKISKCYAMGFKRRLVHHLVQKSVKKSKGGLNFIHLLESDAEEALRPYSEKPTCYCSFCNFRSHSGAALFQHRKDHACIRKRHLDKLNAIGLLLNTSQPCSCCPWCSKLFTSARSAKLHFVTHFLADAFVCEKCDRRFVSGILCRRHMRLKHGLRKLKIRIILRYDLPLSLQRRISLKPVPPTESSIDAVDASNIPVEIIQLTEAHQFPPTSFTEQLSQEVVWLSEPESHIPEVPQPSVIIVPPDPVQEQLTDTQILPVDQSFVLGEGFQSGDMFLLPQGSTLDNLDSYNQSVFYSDQASFVDAPAFDTDYQPMVDFVQEANSALDFNTEVTIATEPPPPLPPPAPHPPSSSTQEGLDQQAGLADFFGCCQCAARFDSSVALSTHAITHGTFTHYSVCLACGTSRLDAGEFVPCSACGQNAFHRMDALLEDAMIGCARFYCTHCNLVFAELNHLEAHVAELTTPNVYQHQPVVEEVVTMESVQVPACSRRSAQPKKTHFELPAEEVQKIIQSQPTAESSLSERLLYEAACERDLRSYPMGSRRLVEGPSTSSKERPHVCTVCSFRFQRSSDLHRHMFLHTGVRPYSCKFCNRRFILPRRLLAHATRLHGAEGATWATAFLSGRPRSRRFLSTTSITADSLTCHLCGAICGSTSSLHSHMRIHTGTKTYACPHCPLSFRTPIQRKRHLCVCQKRPTEPRTNLDATPVEPSSFDLTPYLINLPQSSGFKDLLTDGIQPAAPPPRTSTLSQKYIKLDDKAGTSSSYISLWQCKNCQESFTTSKTFSNHKCPAQAVFPRTLHQLERESTSEGSSGTRRGPYACSTCTKVFTRPTDLRRHERVHSNERPFVCEICDARFSQSGSLRIHRRIHEESGRRFKCRVCGVAFFVRSNMLRHMARVHGHSTRGGDTATPP